MMEACHIYLGVGPVGKHVALTVRLEKARLLNYLIGLLRNILRHDIRNHTIPERAP